MQRDATNPVAEPGAEKPYPDGRGVSYGGRVEAAPREPALGAVFGLLWRRKGLIASTVALTTLATVLVVFQITSRYTAEAQMLIGTRASKVVDIENVVETLRFDRATLQSEVQVLASRSLAERLVDELGLVETPEFNQRLRPPSLFNPLGWLPASLRTALSGADPAAPATLEEAERRIRNDVVTAVLEAMTFNVVKISRVVTIAGTSEDPKLAAALANTLAGLYLREQLEQKSGAQQQATDWLSERVRTLRDEMEQSDLAVEDYRQQQGLTQSKDTTLLEQQISEVNTQLIAAQARIAEADARLGQARALMQSERGVDAASEVLTAPLIQNLRMQEARLAGEAAQMGSEYGPRHPKMINVTAELADIRANIGVEVGRIVRGLENSLEVAQTRERTLQRSLEGLNAETARQTVAQGRLRVLEREAAADRTLFDVFLGRWKETGQQGDLHRADARIIARATVPSEPSWPNRDAAVAIALVVSVLLALLLVYLVEQVLDRGFRYAEQVEELIGAGTLSLVPMLTAAEAMRAGYVLEEPVSSFAESLRMLHTGLLLADAEGTPPVSVTITSSVAEEGKTFVAVALARLIAKSGRRVLLIDADLRNGQVGKRLELPRRRGLADLLTGRVTSVDDAIQRDEPSGLDVLTAGRTADMPMDILHSGRMRQLIATLKPAYELIIIDSPPALLVSDARTLARLTDKTVFVVRWADTVRRVAAAGFRQLAESEANMAGVVLSMVEAQRGGRYYGYGPGAYGSSAKYAKYYTR